ncbi:MAG: ABC transporter substrate-binding protein [Deltaproteobacteria bacterium]|nr:ABC transporter substrate-binding protein [Deltaproteobacteria bacterium]
MSRSKFFIMVVFVGVFVFSGSVLSAEKALKVGVIRDPVNSTYATPGVEPYITDVYEHLVFVSPNMELVPGLATKWERIDQLTWRFYLRKGVKFHNGKDFNAHTAKFSLDWIKEKVLYSKRLRLKQVNVVDDYTIDIVNEVPLGVTPGFMSHGWSVMSEPESMKAGKPVGTGPFKFDSSVPGQQLVVVKNPNYWQKGIPKVDRIIFKVLKDDSSRVMALMGGEVDVALQIPYPSIGTIEQAGFKVFKTVTSQWASVSFAVTAKPTDDVRVRKAIVHGIDRNQIVKDVLYGLAVPGNSPILPNTPWSGEKKLLGLPYDPKKAEALLDDAGWKKGAGGIREKDGEKLAITLRMIDEPSVLIQGREMAQVIAEQLGRIGFKVAISIEEPNMFYDQSAANKKGNVYLDYHGTFSGELSATLWDSYQPNRETYLEGSALYGAMIPPQVGQWLATIQNANNDKDREENLIKITNLASYDMVLTVPFMKFYMVVGAAKKVEGYTPHPLFFWPGVWNSVEIK